MICTYTKAIIELNENQWALLYEENTKNILMDPQQAAGFYAVADVLVVADTKEELEQYIQDHGLIEIYDTLEAEGIEPSS